MGTRDLDEVQWVKKLKATHGVHLIALHETQVSDSLKLKVHTFWVGTKLESEFINAIVRLGGLLSIWDPIVLVKRVVIKHRNFLAIHGVMVSIQHPICVINVYGPQDTREKRQLWDTLLAYM